MQPYLLCAAWPSTRCGAAEAAHSPAAEVPGSSCSARLPSAARLPVTASTSSAAHTASLHAVSNPTLLTIGGGWTLRGAVQHVTVLDHKHRRAAIT